VTRYAAALSRREVKEIKRLFRVGFTDKEIADRIGCRPSMVRHIRVGETYRTPGEVRDWPAAVRSRQA
jgi:hypothetical protein